MEPVVRPLEDLLDQHQDALVAAIDGRGLFVPMPASVRLTTQRVSVARSALDLVAPSDRMAVVQAWELVRETGSASIEVSLAGTGQRASMTFLDVSSDHGVVIGVVAVQDVGATEPVPAPVIPPGAPRFARSRKSESAVLTEIDSRFTAMLGWEASDVVGQRSLDFIHPDDRERAILLWLETIGEAGATGRARLRHRHHDGRWIWLDISNTNLIADHGYVDCEMIDISEEMDAHDAVRASEQLLRRLAEALPVGVVHFDAAGDIVYANDCFYATVGAERETESATLLRCVVEPDVVKGALSAVFQGLDSDVELHIDRLDGGGRRRCTFTVRALVSDGGTVTGGVGCLADVTDAANMRAELEHRATYDALTGCVNRPTVLSILTSCVGRSQGRATSRGVAVVFIDLNGFKSVNDGFGHTVGDGLLAALGRRLRDAVRGGDVVGRLGGDEFLAVCPGIADADTAAAIAERLSAAIAVPLEVDGIALTPTASVGVAWTTQRTAIDGEALVAEADAAMYAAKHAGDGRPVVAESRQSGATAVR